MREFPKDLHFQDHFSTTIRPMQRTDREAVKAFFLSVPPGDRLYLRHDVADAHVIDRWCSELDYDKILPLVAVSGESIVAVASLHQTAHGWSRHVGEIRMVVGPSYRRRGLSRVMMYELVRLAVARCLSMVDLRFLAPQANVMKGFQKIGFKVAATLKNHGKDIHGKIHDVIVMSNDVTELWRQMDDLVLWEGARRQR